MVDGDEERLDGPCAQQLTPLPFWLKIRKSCFSRPPALEWHWLFWGGGWLVNELGRAINVPR